MAQGTLRQAAARKDARNDQSKTPNMFSTFLNIESPSFYEAVSQTERIQANDKIEYNGGFLHEDIHLVDMN